MVAREIPLTNGGVALVDDADYEAVSAFRWQRHRNGYAYRCKSRYRKSRQAGLVLLMHREITKAPAHLDVDHIDGNPANNRRANLRLCTAGQNGANQRKALTRRGIPCSSSFVGVSFHKINQNWIARLAKQHIGSFATELEAAKARDEAAIAKYGEYARLNINTAGKK